MSRYWYKFDDGLEKSEGTFRGDDGLLRFLRAHFAKSDIKRVAAVLDNQGWYHYDTHDIVLEVQKIKKETDAIPTLTKAIERSG